MKEIEIREHRFDILNVRHLVEAVNARQFKNDVDQAKGRFKQIVDRGFSGGDEDAEFLEELKVTAELYAEGMAACTLLLERSTGCSFTFETRTLDDLFDWYAQRVICEDEEKPQEQFIG